MSYKARLKRGGRARTRYVPHSAADPAVSVLDLAALAVGQAMTCTAAYRITPVDVTHRKAADTATVTATDPGGLRLTRRTCGPRPEPCHACLQQRAILLPRGRAVR
jgi:hypothetical protein